MRDAASKGYRARRSPAQRLVLNEAVPGFAPAMTAGPLAALRTQFSLFSIQITLRALLAHVASVLHGGEKYVTLRSSQADCLRGVGIGLRRLFVGKVGLVLGSGSAVHSSLIPRESWG